MKTPSMDRLDANRDIILRRMQEGVLQHDLAKEMKVTGRTLRQWFRDRGLTWTKQEAVRGVATCDMTVRDMAARGHPIKMIAKVHGFSIKVVRKYCKENGIAIRPAPRQRGLTFVDAPRDESEIGLAIDFMRRFYVPVYRSKTTGANDDTIICGNLKLSPDAFIQKAYGAGFGVK